LNARPWRDPRLQPKTAFSRLLPVHADDFEGQKKVDSVEKPLNRPLVEKWFRRCDSLV